jgi:hypothetical protein
MYVALRSTFFQLGMFRLLLCSKSSSHSSISQALIKCKGGVSQIVNPHKKEHLSMFFFGVEKHVCVFKFSRKFITCESS